MNNETIDTFDAAVAGLDIPGDNYNAADLIETSSGGSGMAKQMTPEDVAHALLALHVYGPGLAVLLWDQIEHLRGRKRRGWDLRYLAELVEKAQKLSLHRRLGESI